MSTIQHANNKLHSLYGIKHIEITEQEIESVYDRQVLSIDSDAKTSKGVTLGYLTGILYLSPSDLFTETSLCPYASAECRSVCLFGAGRGQFYSTTRARVVRTLAYLNDPERFIFTIRDSIKKLQKKAKRLNLIPVIRLNGTSDINWSQYNLKDDLEHIDIFEYFGNIQFYDYTKDPRKAINNKHTNYHITFSDSGVNQVMIRKQPTEINIAVVFNNSLPDIYHGRRVIDGDLNDLRFLDPKGIVVGLRAKGKAKKLNNSFIKKAG